MGKKLYVGNLSYNVSSSDLEQLFSQFGSVQSLRSSPIARRAGARASGSSRWAMKPKPARPSTVSMSKSTTAADSRSMKPSLARLAPRASLVVAAVAGPALMADVATKSTNSEPI